MRYTINQLRGLTYNYLYSLSNRFEDFLNKLYNEGLDDTQEYQNALDYLNMINDTLDEKYYR
jgi:hypothetical protein